jgi:hypothetical protein
MTYQRIFDKSNTTCVTSGAGTVYPFGYLNKIQGFDQFLSKHFFYILKDTQSREKHNKGVEY